MYESRGPTVYSLHRFMIDAMQQRQGVGLAAMKLIMRELFDLGAETIYLSFRPENEAARALYDRLGFVFHIVEPDGEVVFRHGPAKDLGT